MITCIYCGKGLIQPTNRHHDKVFRLERYLKKDGSKIFTKAILDYMVPKQDFKGEICDNALDNKSSLEKRQKKFQQMQTK